MQSASKAKDLSKPATSICCALLREANQLPPECCYEITGQRATRKRTHIPNHCTRQQREASQLPRERQASHLNCRILRETTRIPPMPAGCAKAHAHCKSLCLATARSKPAREKQASYLSICCPLFRNPSQLPPVYCYE